MKTLEKYGKAMCRGLFRDIFLNFPREIRDAVYDYIIPSKIILIEPTYRILCYCATQVLFKNYFDSTSPTELAACTPDHEDGNSETECLFGPSPMVYHPRRFGDFGRVDIVWDEEYVGTQARSEIGEHYYRTCTFLFREDLTVLPKFRITDQWNLGFSPFQFISKVKVSFECTEYDFEAITSIEGGSGFALPVESMTNEKYPRRIASNLEELFGLRPGTEINVKLYARGWWQHPDLDARKSMHEEAIPLILPTLRRLIEANFRIKLEVQLPVGLLGDRVFRFPCSLATVGTIADQFLDASKSSLVDFDRPF